MQFVHGCLPVHLIFLFLQLTHALETFDLVVFFAFIAIAGRRGEVKEGDEQSNDTSCSYANFEPFE